MNARAYDAAFARLGKSKFRSRFHLSEADRKYIAGKGIETIRRHCEDFIRTRLAPANPLNDGKQTPMRGHPVFVAQNACACCSALACARLGCFPMGRNHAIRPEIPALFLPGTRYRKTGVVFFGLEKVGTARQMDLFTPPVESKASPLYKTIDALNARFGKGKVFSASEGIGERSWKMKRSKLSKRASTRWDELMVVK